MEAIGKVPAENQMLYWVVCAVWGLAMAFVGAVGIGLLAKLSSWLPIFPLAFIALAAIANKGGLGNFSTNVVAAEGVIGVAISLAMFAALQATVGFFASAGVAGTDFGMNSRNENDVALGGFFGITVAAIVAGVLAILAIAGAAGKNPEIATMISNKETFPAFFASIAETGSLAKVSAWVFVIACICPTGFCAFLASNAFSTVLSSKSAREFLWGAAILIGIVISFNSISSYTLKAVSLKIVVSLGASVVVYLFLILMTKLQRIPMTLLAGLIGVILAATGIANNLVGFFLMVGAAFGPIAGVMLADYVRSGGWKGPRKGINWAGYIAWAFGLVLGLLGVITKKKFGYGLEALIPMVAAAAAYFALAGLGLESETISLEEKKDA